MTSVCDRNIYGINIVISGYKITYILYDNCNEMEQQYLTDAATMLNNEVVSF
jgi:hypothetical protein